MQAMKVFVKEFLFCAREGRFMSDLGFRRQALLCTRYMIFFFYNILFNVLGLIVPQNFSYEDSTITLNSTYYIY